MKRKPKLPPPPSEVETFQDPRGYWLNDFSLRWNEPSCFNGEIRIKRYRITVVEIGEPQELLIERLRKLWRTCDNHHHWGPLHIAAKKLGIEIPYGEFGVDRKKEPR